MNWSVFPSGNSAAAQKCSDAWRAAGWLTAVLIDADQSDVVCDLLIREPDYRGTGAAFNRIISALPDWKIIACVNDDMFPDPCDAKVAAQLMFALYQDCGVIQPIGKYFDGNAHAATSPIIGRGYVERFGPAWDERFFHLWGDARLRDLAIERGLFHESKLLGVDHRHHTQKHPDNLPREKRLKNNARHAADRALYDKLKNEVAV